MTTFQLTLAVIAATVIGLLYRAVKREEPDPPPTQNIDPIYRHERQKGDAA